MDEIKNPISPNRHTPTIDGRQGGVRESLEEKTMALAKAVARCGAQ
ncbi:MAG: hypothetical protein PUF44_05630 [Bacteroidales bacterium]|nr:hypothetical protein [Bacteroidales bacterium]